MFEWTTPRPTTKPTRRRPPPGRQRDTRSRWRSGRPECLGGGKSPRRRSAGTRKLAIEDVLRARIKCRSFFRHSCCPLWRGECCEARGTRGQRRAGVARRAARAPPARQPRARAAQPRSLAASTRGCRFRRGGRRAAAVPASRGPRRTLLAWPPVCGWPRCDSARAAAGLRAQPARLHRTRDYSARWTGGRRQAAAMRPARWGAPGRQGARARAGAQPRRAADTRRPSDAPAAAACPPRGLSSSC